MRIHAQLTPNPNSMKFQLSERKFERGQSIMSIEDARTKGNKLAEAIFAIGNVTEVFMTADFVSVNKDDGSDWGGLVPQIEEILRGWWD